MQALHNQTQQDPSAMPSVQDGKFKIHSVPLVMATAETLQGYGRLVPEGSPVEVDIVTWPAQGWRPIVPGTGNEAGTVKDTFEMERVGGVLYAVNHAVNRHYITGWYGDPAVMSDASDPQHRQAILTHEANYHPDGGQVFLPRQAQPFIGLLALPGDDVTPQDFVAFYFDGSCGVHVDPGVWHQPMFPVDDQMAFDDEQGAVHACVGVDFVTEFGCYLRVPLTLQGHR